VAKQKPLHIPSIGKKIAKLRHDSGMTQEQLAEKADLHWRTIQKIESETQNPSYVVLYKLKRAFNCSWDEFMPS